MSALSELRGAGLDVVALEDGRLKVTPAALLTNALRDFARTHRGEILAELAQNVEAKRARLDYLVGRPHLWPDELAEAQALARELGVTLTVRHEPLSDARQEQPAEVAA